MGKSVVYSWRLRAERKAQIEDVARRRRRPLAELLDEAVTQWLGRQESDPGDDEQRIRRLAQRAFGRIRGGDPERAARAREHVRAKLQKARTGG